MKIALLGMYHETNTFSKVEADYDAFEIYRGYEIIEQYKDSHSTNAGFNRLISITLDLISLLPTSLYSLAK